MKALHATAVSHYEHVVQAMFHTFDDVGLLSRWELPEASFESIARLPLPRSVLTTVRRRVREIPAVPHVRSTFGPMQLVPPLAARTGHNLSRGQFRTVGASYARRAASLAKQFDVLHFTEGIGFLALEEGEFALTVCERRAMHHEVYESNIDVIGSFPLNGRPDPVADRLSYEYEKSDVIVTYSQAAKRSFLDRGFSPEKVAVVPVPMGTQLSRIDRPRNSFDLVFVGRGDAFKGLDLAVAAVETLGHPYRLKFAGSMTPAVSKWLKDHPCVDYLGYLSRTELRDIYSSSGAMILPSIESFGLAAAEAVFHGLPLICSPDTGVAEFLPDEAVHLVSGRDPAIWAQSAQRALASRDANDRTFLREIDNSFKKLQWNVPCEILCDLYSSHIH